MKKKLYMGLYKNAVDEALIDKPVFAGEEPMKIYM